MSTATTKKPAPARAVPLNILVSYAFLRSSMRVLEPLLSRPLGSFRLLIDSGAFSVWQKGDEISVDEYASFIRKVPPELNARFIQLDVIGNASKTRENLLRLLDMGLNVIPVFQRSADLATLDELHALSDLVCLGGIARGAGTQDVLRRFTAANAGRPVHWLGFTSAAFIKAFKPTSVDADRLSVARRFREIRAYSGFGRNVKIDMRALGKTGRVSERERAALRRSGFSNGEVARLTSAEAWTPTQYPTLQRKGCAYFMHVAAAVHANAEIERYTGTAVYHVVVTHEDVSNLLHAADHLEARGVLNWPRAAPRTGRPCRSA